MRLQRFVLFALMGMEATLIADILLVIAAGPLLQRAIPLSVQTFGWIVGCYGLSAAVADLAVSTFIDRFSRRRALLFFYGCFLTGVLSTGVSHGPAQLFVARILCGASGGLVSALVRAAIRDTLPEQRLGRGVGVVLSGYSFATIAAVPTGLVLAKQHSWEWAFLALSTVGVAVFLTAWGATRLTSLPSLNKNAGRDAPTWNAAREVVINPKYRQALALAMLVTFSGYSVVPLFSTFLTQGRPGLVQALPYLYLAAGFGTAVLLNITGALVDRFGRRRTFYGTQIIASGFTLLLTNAAGFSEQTLTALAPFFLVTMSVRNVPATSIVISAAKEGQRAGFLSFTGAVQQFVAGLASVFGGYVALSRGLDLERNYWLLGVGFTVCAIAGMALVARMNVDSKATGSPPDGDV
jgi:predicted MFS family arabinose efflux permease